MAEELTRVEEGPIGEVIDDDGTVTPILKPDFSPEELLHEEALEAYEAEIDHLEELAKRIRGRRSMALKVPTMDVVKACLKAKDYLEKGSLKSYGFTWGAFAKRYPILPTTPQEIESYLAHYPSKRSAHDVHTKLGLLYKFAEQRYGALNPMKEVQKPRFKRERKATLTLEEAKSVHNACQSDRERGLIHLYLDHGLRESEALRLNIEHIQNGSMFITGKTANEPMPLLDETKEILLRLANGREPEEPVFLSQFKRRLSGKMVYRIIKDIFQRAGIARRGLSTHTLRHSFATLMVEKGLDEISCRRLMRHSERSVTEGYVHLGLEQLRAKLEEYSPIRRISGNGHKLDKISK
jgi:integrase/recombinase XerD